MKFITPTLFALLAGFAAAATIPESAAPEISPNVPEVDVLERSVLEARKACTGERRPSDVCGGVRLGAPLNSGHNWYGHQIISCFDLAFISDRPPQQSQGWKMLR